MNCKHLLITRIFFLSINLYKDLIMKILFFVFILSTNLFLVNTYSQDINLDFNCDYPMDSSDEKWSNSTLKSYDVVTTNLKGRNAKFHCGLTNVSTANSDLNIVNSFLQNINT